MAVAQSSSKSSIMSTLLILGGWLRRHDKFEDSDDSLSACETLSQASSGGDPSPVRMRRASNKFRTSLASSLFEGCPKQKIMSENRPAERDRDFDALRQTLDSRLCTVTEVHPPLSTRRQCYEPRPSNTFAHEQKLNHEVSNLARRTEASLSKLQSEVQKRIDNLQAMLEQVEDTCVAFSLQTSGSKGQYSSLPGTSTPFRRHNDGLGPQEGRRRNQCILAPSGTPAPVVLSPRKTTTFVKLSPPSSSCSSVCISQPAECHVGILACKNDESYDEFSDDLWFDIEPMTSVLV
jgi:hypothetical protein